MHGKPNSLRTDASFVRKRMMQVKQSLNTYLRLHLPKQSWYALLALLLLYFARRDILTDEFPLLSSEVDGSSASPKRLRVVFSGFQMQEGHGGYGHWSFQDEIATESPDWMGMSKNGKNFVWEELAKSFAKICKDLLMVRSSTASIWSSQISRFRARLRPRIGELWLYSELERQLKWEILRNFGNTRTCQQTHVYAEPNDGILGCLLLM